MIFWYVATGWIESGVAQRMSVNTSGIPSFILAPPRTPDTMPAARSSTASPRTRRR